MDRWLDGSSIAELAPEVLSKVDINVASIRTVDQALEDMLWVRDIKPTRVGNGSGIINTRRDCTRGYQPLYPRVKNCTHTRQVSGGYRVLAGIYISKNNTKKFRKQYCTISSYLFESFIKLYKCNKEYISKFLKACSILSLQ